MMMMMNVWPLSKKVQYCEKSYFAHLRSEVEKYNNITTKTNYLEKGKKKKKKKIPPVTKKTLGAYLLKKNSFTFFPPHE